MDERLVFPENKHQMAAHPVLNAYAACPGSADLRGGAIVSWYVEVAAWPANVTGVMVDQHPVAPGEMVSVQADFNLSWSLGGVPDADWGRINHVPPALPALAWNGAAVPPVAVRPLFRGTQVLAGRYRRRATEIARWQMPAVNASPNRWLIHPGAMTGDLWHIAAAMLINANLNLVVVWNRANPGDDRNANALIDLLDSLGIAQARVLRQTSQLAAAASIGNEQARQEGVQRVRNERGATIVGHTWASTSVVVERAFPGGAGPAQQLLSNQYANALAASGQFQANQAAYAGYSLNWIAALAPATQYVLVNMRWTGLHGQNPQHNITQARFAQIVARAAAFTAAGRATQVIRIGVPEIFAPADCGWAAGAAGIPVDIFCDAPGAPAGLDNIIRGNKLFQAYFWQQVAAAGANFHLVGGRSGGMDIASFMGVRSASWDQPDANDLNYMRLHWAAPYNSIIADAGGVLDDGALEYWMRGGDLIPLVAGDPVNGTVVGTSQQYAATAQAFNALWYPL
jgi:hypothetical protein